VLLVPVQAVAQKAEKHYSYISNGQGIERREVEVGENNEKFIEIKNGVAAGEQVALDARARMTAELKAEESNQPQPETGQKEKKKHTQAKNRPKKKEKKHPPQAAATR